MSMHPAIFSVFISIVLATSAIAQEPAAQANPTIAVLNFDVQQGVTAEEGRLLSDRMAIEIDKTGKFTLINREKMGEQLALGEFSRLNSCSASECAVEAGRILGANYMIYGSVGRIGNTYSMHTYLISVESGATLQSASSDAIFSLEKLLTQGVADNAGKLVVLKEDIETGLPTCAVLTYDSRGGVSSDEVRIFSDRLAIELDSFNQYVLVPRSKMADILEEQQFSRTEECSASDCAIEAGRLLGVRYMIYGSVGKVGRIYAINSYMIDVETGAAVKTANTDFRGNKEEVLVKGMRLNAVSLLNSKVSPLDIAYLDAGKVNQSIEPITKTDSVQKKSKISWPWVAGGVGAVGLGVGLLSEEGNSGGESGGGIAGSWSGKEFGGDLSGDTITTKVKLISGGACEVTYYWSNNSQETARGFYTLNGQDLYFEASYRAGDSSYSYNVRSVYRGKISNGAASGSVKVYDDDLIWNWSFSLSKD
jgi:TolB-like protein